jgi:hypothetical protein
LLIFAGGLRPKLVPKPGASFMNVAGSAQFICSAPQTRGASAPRVKHPSIFNEEVLRVTAALFGKHDPIALS